MEGLFALEAKGRKRSATLDEVLLHPKREITDEIKRNFARYGDLISGIITREALKINGLQNILMKLGVSGLPQFKRQVERFAQYLAQNGTGEFLRHMERDSKTVGKSTSGRPLAEIHDKKPIDEDSENVDTANEIAGDQEESIDSGSNLQGGYNGEERRSGEERRVYSNRRNTCEAISKNRRWGKDRRQYIRRMCDRS
jgi:hypothetical protein